MYSTIQELVALAEKQGSALWEPILDNECKISGMAPDEIFAQLECCVASSSV